MPEIKINDGKEYELKVFTKDGEKFRIALDDDSQETLIGFAMRKLTTSEVNELDDSLADTKGNLRLGSTRNKRLKRCVRGWKNIIVDGAEFPFNHANLDKLPGPLLTLLDNHIVDANGMREEAAKNS